MKKEDSLKLVLEAVPQIVKILRPLTPEERQRVVTSAMVLFGEPTPTLTPKPQNFQEPPKDEGGISGRALAWMEKNGITRAQIEHVFCIESDSIEVIASRMPASGKRQQTVQAYLLCGVKSYLKAGEPTFSESDGRDLCNKVGCYDVANHSNYRKAFGNFLTGSKDSGWKVTNPGLSEGVKIIKQLVPTEAVK